MSTSCWHVCHGLFLAVLRDVVGVLVLYCSLAFRGGHPSVNTTPCLPSSSFNGKCWFHGPFCTEVYWSSQIDYTDGIFCVWLCRRGPKSLGLSQVIVQIKANTNCALFERTFFYSHVISDSRLHLPQVCCQGSKRIPTLTTRHYCFPLQLCAMYAKLIIWNPNDYRYGFCFLTTFWLWSVSIISSILNHSFSQNNTCFWWSLKSLMP